MTYERETGASRVAGTPAEDTAPVTDERYAQEPVVREETVDRSRPVDVTTAQRRDRVGWGAIWAGVIVALPTFLLLELILFATGGLTLGLDPDASATTAGWITGILALAAFFLGGLTAGASTMWRGVSDGLLHGILVWALSVVGIILFTLLGGGALLGPLAETVSQVGQLQQQVLQADPNIQVDEALNTAQDGAAWAVLGLGLSVIAAAAGGLVGAKMWPRGDQDRSIDVR